MNTANHMCKDCGRVITEVESTTTLEGALRQLLASDGHTQECAFRGCTCGRVEQYAIARAEACRILRAERG